MFFHWTSLIPGNISARPCKTHCNSDTLDIKGGRQALPSLDRKTSTSVWKRTVVGCDCLTMVDFLLMPNYKIYVTTDASDRGYTPPPIPEGFQPEFWTPTGISGIWLVLFWLELSLGRIILGKLISKFITRIWGIPTKLPNWTETNQTQLNKCNKSLIIITNLKCNCRDLNSQPQQYTYTSTHNH